ncbi:MAG TPA: tetratricopeptide repeat protein [Holophagaceae bacterium]|nr:tetratricopeptide repeat protein [Holophagaceae bacterium]
MTRHPKHPKALLDQAVAHEAAGRLPQAEESYRRYLEDQPGDAKAWAGLGATLCKVGRAEEAEEACRRAVKLEPEHVGGLFHLGVALSLKGRHREAEPCFLRVLERQPRDLFARLALGECLLQTGRESEALPHLEQVLAKAPGNTQAFRRVLLVHHLLGHDAEAMRLIEDWIRKDPGNPDRIWERGVRHLFAGRYREGWRDYEARLEARDQTRTPIGPFVQPRWDGRPFPGRTLLLHAEQGFGDTLMFIRFAKLAKARGGRVVALVQPQLRDLIATCEGVDVAVSFGDLLPTFDCYLPLLSLPGVFGIEEATLPAEVPYLQVPARIPNGEALSRIFAVPTERLRIGYAWAGSSGNREDSSRSLRPESLAPLGAIPDTAWHCFQMPSPPSCPFPSVPLSPLLSSFSDTAFALSHMDLVITVDTALAHLAGALGIPTFLMLRKNSEWRWQMDRTDSPWYPTLRIYRQPRLGDWDAVIHAIVADLTGGGGTEAPSSALEWAETAERLRLEHRLPEAVEAADRALELDAELVPATATLGLALAGMERFEEAETPLRHALGQRPDDTPARLSLVECLIRRGDFDSAVEQLEVVLRVEPSHAGALQRQLEILTALGDRPGAIRTLDRWLAVAPDRVDLRWERGTIHLMEGHYLQGWEDFEARLELGGHAPTDPGAFIRPRWGGAPFPGKTLLLHSEQGLGDTLMFIRFARKAKARGGRVIAVVQPSLVDLIATCEGVDLVVPNDAPWPPCDLHLPLLSLPKVLHVEAEDIPCEVPYLSVPPWTPNRTVLQEVLSVPTRKLRVGYAWSAGTHNAVPSTTFARLGSLPEVAWHCFQVPVPEALPIRSVPLSPLLTTFSDMASALESMDLVITVDAPLAHLAGAFGIPTFLILPFGADWRWQWDRSDSPWYPTLRVYRQASPGDWDSAIDAILRDLTQDQ